MKLRACALGLLAGALTGIAVAGGTGIARADPATDRDRHRDNQSITD
jgi:hypothetical protein